MNLAPGGAAPLMRSTIISEIDEFNTNFVVGGEQNMFLKKRILDRVG